MLLNKQVKEKLKSTERIRTEKIAKMMEKVAFPTIKDRVECVISFTNSTLSEAEIEALTANLPVRTDYIQDQLGTRGLY